MRAVLISGWLCLLWAAVARADDQAVCQVHVILFVPADVKPPSNPQVRIDQIVTYAEAFFKRELKRWGHDHAVSPFHRTKEGKVEVMMVRGKQKLSEYKPVEVRVEVMDTLRRQKKIEGPKQVWWIMVYPGPPPAKFAGFLGGFGPQIGGWAVCNLDTSPGKIEVTTLLGADFLEKIALKGMLHELGHAFGLPHVGPLRRDDAGNTLMGPTHANYRRVMPRPEDRVYLSEAEAAMLARHPAFRGGPDDRGPLPRVETEGLRYVVDATKKSMTIRGTVRGSKRASYALVADESEARPGEYWTKTYVGKVGADGAFEVVLSEPYESRGTLRLWFVFEDGAMTGDGKSRGRESGVPKAYTFSNGQWSFQ
jgi:hypothetical protein